MGSVLRDAPHFFMELITKLPTYSDGEINKALYRELTMGLELKKQWENRREIQAAQEAKEKQGMREINGLGRCVGVIPEWEYFRMKQKYGNDEVHSKEFMKYFQKSFPHLAPNKL